MPRDFRASENRTRAKYKRQSALARAEFAYPSEPRVASAGPTLFPIKVVDAASRELIDEFLQRRAQSFPR